MWVEVLYNILDDSPTVKRDVRISREYLLDLLQEGWMLCFPGEKWSDVGDMAESPFADCILYMMNHPVTLFYCDGKNTLFWATIERKTLSW